MWKTLETHKTTLPWKIKAPEHGHATETLQPVSTDIGVIIAKTFPLYTSGKDRYGYYLKIKQMLSLETKSLVFKSIIKKERV